MVKCSNMVILFSDRKVRNRKIVEIKGLSGCVWEAQCLGQLCVCVGGGVVSQELSLFFVNT
jgi:hypothetical protein